MIEYLLFPYDIKKLCDAVIARIMQIRIKTYKISVFYCAISPDINLAPAPRVAVWDRVVISNLVILYGFMDVNTDLWV